MSLTAQIEITRDALRADVDRTSAALQVFPRGPMGLTPDSVKGSAEYCAAKLEFDRAFAALRKFNTTFKPTRKRA